MPALTQKHRLLAIGTPLGEDVLLVRRFTATEALSQPFEYQLELASEQADVAFKDILGQSVTIRLELSGGGTRFFSGIVSRFAQAGQSGRVFNYRATVVPWLWLLTRRADCRIFQDMKVPDIVKKVFRDGGFTDFREALSGTYRNWEYCVQYRETDFDFVSRLMEHEGIYYYFEHDNGKHTLVLADSVNAHAAFAGYAQVPFRPFERAAHGKEIIHDWRGEELLQSGEYAVNDFDFKAPRKMLVAKARQPAPHLWGELPVYDYPGAYHEPADGQRYAQVRLQGLQAGHQVFFGSANARGLAAGCLFNLTDCPANELNREYLITQVSHTLRGDAFEAERNGGEREFCSVRVTAIDARTPFRAPCISPKPIVQGPQTAMVVGKAGEEIWTDPYGRVKVKFHWDRYGKADENSSCWIRVAQNWAGRKWGAFFLPRIGQEVIVEFLEGDPDRPIVTGCVYNGDTPTPYELPRDATKSTLKSNSSKGGNGFNEIRFEDKLGEEQIFIHGQRDFDLRVRGDFRETNYGHREIRVGWEKDGQAGGNLNTFVRKDVNTHVEGGQVERVDQQLHQSVGGEVVEGYDKSQTTFVKETLTVNAKEIVIEGATAIHQKSGKIAIEGAQGVHIKGATVAIEGSTGVSLKVGGNFVSVTADGVAINGSTVLINSGGAPLSAETPKSASSIELQEPLVARVADSGQTGETTRTSAAPIGGGKYTLKSRSAPKFVPLPTEEIVVPPKPPPKELEDVKGCPKPAWKVKCQHKRAAGMIGDRIALEVVSSRSRKTVVNVGGELKLFSANLEWGDDDQLAVELTNFQICGTCGCKPAVQAQLSETKIIPAGGGRAAARFEGKSRHIWLAGAEPYVGQIRTEGARCLDEAIEIRVYPNEKYTVEASTEKLADRVQPLLDRLAELIAAFCDAVPKIQIPKFKLSGEWGWEEEAASPRAYFKWRAKVSGSLFKFEEPPQHNLEKRPITLDVSLNKFFGPGAYILSYAADFRAYLQLSPKVELNLAGGSTGPSDLRITGGVEGEVALSFGLELVPGPAMKVKAYKIDASLITTVTGRAKAAYDTSKGPGLAEMQIAWKGLEAEVKFEVKGGGWFSWAEAKVSRKCCLLKGGSFPSEPGLEWFPFLQEAPSSS